MTEIPGLLRLKLAKIVRLLGSDEAGEVAAAAQALKAALASAGCDLHDLSALIEGTVPSDDPGETPHPWRPKWTHEQRMEAIGFLRQALDDERVFGREVDFARQMIERVETWPRRSITGKQERWIARIVARASVPRHRTFHDLGEDI